jgi:DNA-binding transcriptional MocR family regulator
MRAQNHNTKAEPGFVKRRNRISGQWSPRLIEMLESPAYRALSLSAHRAMARIEIELAHHGGNDNGRLPVTFEDFIAYGIHHNAVAPAIRELEALGFVRVTERGRGGNSEHRQPNKFFLTFAHSRESRQSPPTHDWRKIKTLEEAMEIAQAARSNKDPRAVQFAHRRSFASHRYARDADGMSAIAPIPTELMLRNETTRSGHERPAFAAMHSVTCYS